MVHDFNIANVDSDRHRIVSWDDKEVPYDLLVTVPPNMGDPMIERSGLGDELNFVPTDKHTLQSKAHKNIFVIEMPRTYRHRKPACSALQRKF